MPGMGRPVAIVAFDDFQLLDLAGPADVFRAATLLGADPAYEVRTVAPSRSVTSDSGMRLTRRRACSAPTSTRSTRWWWSAASA